MKFPLNCGVCGWRMETPTPRLGDRVAILIRRLGLGWLHCQSCDKRQTWLNQLDQWARRKVLAIAQFLHPR